MHHLGRIPPVEAETNYYADISAGRPAKHITEGARNPGRFNAAVATDRDLQRGGPPAQRFVREPPHHGVAWRPLAAAAAAPLVGLDDPAGQDRTVGPRR